MSTRLLLVHALSPLHAGTGRAVGAIDLPIARERPTGIPLLPGSSIKGALRARCGDPQWARDIFGPDTNNASEYGGSVQFSDVHVVLLPVRSLAGTFAWVTSSYLLQRFARTAKEAGVTLSKIPAAPSSKNICTIVGETLTLQESRKVVLEDLDFTAEIEGEKSVDLPLVKLATELARLVFPGQENNEWQQYLTRRVCLVHDDVMSFLLETAVEVTARIRLEPDSKTVADGALWYEEALPCETVLAGLAVASDTKKVKDRRECKADELLKEVAKLTEGLVQLGGKATVGHGSCAVRVVGG